MNELLSGWARERTVADFVQRFAEVGIPASPVRTYAEAAADRHVRERDMVQPVTGPEGEIPVVGPAAKLSRTPTRVRSPAPPLGAHNREILEELGYTPEQIRAITGDENR